MNLSEYFNFEFSDRFRRSPARLRPNSRGRGHQNRHQSNRQLRQQNSGSHNQTYRQLLIDFRDSSINQSINKPNVKPKYETIVVELSDNSDKLTDDILKQHFQQNYGNIRKIWFNNTRSKAFICFYNHMSVDMCLESGNCVTITGLSVKVCPLEVTIPQELLFTNEDLSFQLKTLCKSNNKNLVSDFPIKEESVPKPSLILTRNQLLNLVKIERIDEKKLLDDVLNAKTITDQMTVLKESLLLTHSDLLRRNQFKDYLQEVLNSNGFECRLHFIGSTVNGLGFRDSDIDVFIETFDYKQKSFDETMASLKTIHTILKRILKMFIPHPIPSHRCPIVRLVFNETPFVKNAGCEALVCDLSLSNALGVRNSRLIRHFTRLEPRFQELCLLLRFWAKINGFVGSSHMSSYAFTHLVIFFCQKEGLLPSVERLREAPDMGPLVINGWDSSFSENTDLFSDNQKNSDSIIELLNKFFAFYSNFDFSHLILSTKTGLTKLKSEAFHQMDTSSDDEVSAVTEDFFKLTPIVSIEDPFELTHNLCANLNYNTFDKFCEYLTHICSHFKEIFVEKCEEILTETEGMSESVPNLWGLSPLCRVWDPIPTGYVFPEHYIGFANLDLILSAGMSQTPTDLMRLMANRLIDLTVIWLSNVYRIESLLVSKYHLICGQLSPFAEFYIKVRGLDSRAIDLTTRLETRKQLTEEQFEVKELNTTEIETQITDRIHQQFNCDVTNLSVVPIDCHFALVMNCRTTSPTIELVVIDMKPDFGSSKPLMGFLRRMIATAANEHRILTCPHELISPSI